MDKNQPTVTSKSEKGERLPLGLSRTRDLEALGFSRTAIRRMVERGLLECVGRGVYASAYMEANAHRSFAEVALHAPNTAVCLLSALEYRDLTTQYPFQV